MLHIVLGSTLTPAMKSLLTVLLVSWTWLGLTQAKDASEYHYLAKLEAISETSQGVSLDLTIRKENSPLINVRFLIPPESPFHAKLHHDLARFDQEEIFYRISLHFELPHKEPDITVIPSVITEENLRGTAVMPTIRTHILANPDIIAIQHITENEYLEITPKIVKP